MVLYGTDNLSQRSQAYTLLSVSVKEHWGLSSLPEITRASNGKPRFSNADGLEFNLSHSGALALCALDTSPVGVDIQLIKSWRASLPSRVCSEDELSWLQEQDDFWRGFTALWALKESRVKQSGQGLTVPIRSISVPLPVSGQRSYFHQGLWFGLYSGENWMGAVCALDTPPSDIHWRTL